MDNVNLAALLSSGNIEAVILGVAVWFLKGIAGFAGKTLAAFVRIEDRGENIASQQKIMSQQILDMLTEQKKTNDNLERLIQSHKEDIKDVTDGLHEISNILMYNIPPRKIVEKNVANV